MENKTITISKEEFLNVVSRVTSNAIKCMKEIKDKEGSSGNSAIGIMLLYAACGAELTKELFDKEEPEVN